MQDIKIGKIKLLDVLKTNKTKHEKAFHEASAAFYVKYAAALEQVAELVADKEANYQQAMRILQEDYPPQGHCDDYERQILMLEYDTQEIIDLNPNEFVQFVMDEWGWKGEFAASYHKHTGSFYR